jgi:hypothetical protein
MSNAATFSWRALRDQLAQSAYLMPEDDLATQRGIVTAAMAIAERMSDDSRHVSWTPVRILAKRETRAKAVEASAAPPAMDGGALAPKPAPRPSAPCPGGTAVALPLPAEISW